MRESYVCNRLAIKAKKLFSARPALAAVDPNSVRNDLKLPTAFRLLATLPAAPTKADQQGSGQRHVSSACAI